MTGSLLLDTNAVIRMVGQPDRIPVTVRERLVSPATELFLSAASAWEVATKTRSGRLPGGDVLVSTWTEIMDRLRVTQLAIETEDALIAGGLHWEHRDPFDRMIVAQAQRRALAVVTSDRMILGSGLVGVVEIGG